MKNDSRGLIAFLRNNRWAILLLLAGMLLLLLPKRQMDSGEKESVFTQNEERLSAVLGSMDGVGEVCVLLSGGVGRNEEFTGAVVVCRGADDPAVRLRIMETVSAFTGLGTNRIVVQKMIS